MVTTSLGPLTLLIAGTPPHIMRTVLNPALGTGSCLLDGYYGTSISGNYSFYGSRDRSCLDRQGPILCTGHPVRIYDNPTAQLVWFEQSEVDSVLLPAPHILDVVDFAAITKSLVPDLPSHEDQQPWKVFETTPNGWGPTRPNYALDHYEVLDSNPWRALVRLDRRVARHIDTFLPPYWKSMILPDEPAPFVPVPSPAVERVKDILAQVKFDPIIASVVNNISVPQMQADIRYLTGEDPTSGIISRHSFSDGIFIAAGWLKERFEETGANCTLKPFRDGFAPNVICSYSSTVNTTETILLSSHYDSRGSFGSIRAPGGDDDGSGTVGLLSIARAIGRLGITFKKNVQLVTFAGEEQGLLGSRAYARDLKEAGADLTLVVQADMTGYHKPGEPQQLGLPATIGTPEVAQLIANASALYSPELTVGTTTACCSDHQSFHEQGFPATQVFERAGPIADPMYHNSGDISEREGYDLEQIKAIAKVEFATLLHAAGFDLHKHL